MNLRHIRSWQLFSRAGVAMWSSLLALTLLVIPVLALADVKEKVAALAPSGEVLVMDHEGNELVAQNADEPFVPASVTKKLAVEWSGPTTVEPPTV